VRIFTNARTRYGLSRTPRNGRKIEFRYRDLDRFEIAIATRIGEKGILRRGHLRDAADLSRLATNPRTVPRRTDTRTNGRTAEPGCRQWEDATRHALDAA
jgi:hypothetical protein